MNVTTALFCAYTFEQRTIWDNARLGADCMPVLNGRYHELSQLKSELLNDMTNEDMDLVHSCVDPEGWLKTLEMRAHMNKRWKRIEEYNQGIVHPPKAEFTFTNHRLPDVRAYSLKYGPMKHEAKEAARIAKRNEKIGKPDMQEIAD